MRKFLTLVAIALFLNTAPASANGAVTYSFDTIHSQIIFFVDHLGFSKSEGEFIDFDGSFMIDEAAPENSSVSVTIDVNSIDMDMEKWDNHLKSEKFFNVAEHPTITFKSTDVTLTSDTTADVTGDLTMLGITQPITLDVSLNKVGENPRSGKQYVGFSATGMLKRSDFGMTYGIGGIGDDIELRIEVEGPAQE